MEWLRAFFRITLLPPLRLVYRLRVRHADRIPVSGGVLLIANHVSYIDSFILYAACPRPVRYVIVSRYLKIRAIHWFLDLFGAIPITPGHSRDAIRTTAECLRRGDVVCIFPEGQLTRTGVMNGLKKGYEIIARQAGVPVLPVYVNGLWGSIFSAERGRFMRKWPRRIPWPVAVAFGTPRPAESASLDWARQAFRDLSKEAFGAMPQWESSVAAAAIRSLKRRRSAVCFAEHGKSIRRMRRHQVLSTALAISRRWKNAGSSSLGDDPRIGILLPGGTAPALLNLALIFAGRVPVNLPFPGDATGSLDPESLAAAIRVAGLRTVITSRAFAGALGSAGLEDTRFLDMGAEMGGAGLGSRLAERLRAFVEPAWMTLRRLELSGRPSEKPAWACVVGNQVLDFSDRDILAEALRLTSGNWIEAREPIFTERGFSTLPDSLWSFWLPVLHCHPVAGRSWASRTDPSLVETVCREEGVRRLVGSHDLTASLAALPEPWHPETRSRLRSVLVPVESGADLTLLNQRLNPVESIAGAPVCPYWAPGSTRGGILAISQPDPGPHPRPRTMEPQHGARSGSSGRLLPGITLETLPRPVRIDDDGFVFLDDTPTA